MELLASGLVDKSEYDNLFITGAFSLLDALLGVGMEQVLDAMRLPEPISDALLGNGGRYQPFLELALASEKNDGQDDRRAGGHAWPDRGPVQPRPDAGAFFRRRDGVLARAAIRRDTLPAPWGRPAACLIRR
jgi:hypothetical protein